MQKSFECDERIQIPKKYLKWSDEKIERAIKRRELFAKVKNRFSGSTKSKLDLGYKINL